MKEVIKNDIINYVEKYVKSKGLKSIWQKPLCCFTDIYSPYIRVLKENVNPEHIMPEYFLEDAKNVLVYYLPYSKEIVDSNSFGDKNNASLEWANGYIYTDELLGEITEYLIKRINDMGYKAVRPTGIGMDEEKLMSVWSHRHIAYAGGMGTFGINNMLITKSGCCGRYASIVTNLPVEPDKQLEEEYCIYKRTGKCKKCIDNCPTKALGINKFDRFRCFEQCMKNIEVYGVDVCGKCAVGLPCSMTAPMHRENEE